MKRRQTITVKIPTLADQAGKQRISSLKVLPFKAQVARLNPAPAKSNSLGLGEAEWVDGKVYDCKGLREFAVDELAPDVPAMLFCHRTSAVARHERTQLCPSRSLKSHNKNLIQTWWITPLPSFEEAA
ncbi:MAG: hypothetical protein ACRD4K_07650 [Candidatus Acidiferrales bacterium]